MDNPVLDAARAKRAKHQSKLDSLLETPTAEARSLTDSEATEFEELASKITKLDAQISLLEADEVRKAAAVAASAEIVADAPAAIVRSEPMTYDEHRHDTSYLRDLTAIQVPQSGLDANGARERMARHIHEIEVESRKDKTIAQRLADARQEKRVNPNTTAGTGGEFVPPLWLVNQYVPFMRPGRVCANRIQNQPLPPGIDVINIPRLTVGSQAAIQGGNAGAVQSTDIQTTYVSAPVNTIAGQEDISLQLLEQSPIAMDGVVFQDLAADYDQRLDLQVLVGTGSNGQHTGVFNLARAAGTSPTVSQASYVAVTNATPTFFTIGGASPTNASNVGGIISGVNQVETFRYAPPTGIWVHPRRANWWSAQADTQGRPLFVTPNYGPLNAAGVNESSPVYQGVAGNLFGLPVIKDANMPTTASSGAPTGGTQDAAVVLKEDDQILWEGSLKLRALPEILSGTLQIRFQVYAYSALTFGRVPNSVAIVGGSGFAAPTF